MLAVVSTADTSDEMRLGFRKQLQPAATEVGTELLEERLLLARWFILYELDREMGRARRRGTPLAVAVLTPVPDVPERLTPAALMLGAQAAQAVRRKTDLLGWLEDGSILVVMPDTDHAGAEAAVYRWRNDMFTRSWHVGGLRWGVSLLTDASAFETAEDLVASLVAKAKPGAVA